MLAFDTHQYIKRLIAVGVPPEQAEVHSEELKTIIQHDIATKQDIELTKAELKRDIKELELRLQGELVKMQGELNLLKWLTGLVLGGVVSLIVKTFFG